MAVTESSKKELTVNGNLALAACAPLSIREETGEWLEDYLRDGPKTYRDVLRAAEAAGFSARTLHNASVDLGVEKTPRGPHSSIWYLPEPEPADDDLDLEAFERVMEIESLDTWAQAKELIDLVLSLDEEARREVLLALVRKAR